MSESERSYLIFVLQNDIETLRNGDFEELDDKLELETAERLLKKVEAGVV